MTNKETMAETVETAEETSSPQSEVAVETVETPETEASNIEFPDFSELTRQAEEDGDEPEVLETVKTEADPEVLNTEPDPEVETEEVKTPETTETTSETPEPKKETAETAAEVEKLPEVKMPTKEELEGMYKEHREKTLPTLEKLFTLTEDEAAALDEQPSKVIPALAAKLQYDSMLSSYNAVMAALPSVVNRLIAVTKEQQEAENEFFTTWPDLKDSKHQAVVESAIRSYRATKPRATKEDVIKNAGVIAMVNLGLDPSQKKTNQMPAAPAKPSARPATPVSPRGTNQVAPPKTVAETEGNMFADLAEAFRNEHS